MTKKIIAIILAVFMLCSLAACGSKSPATHTDLPVEAPSTDTDIPAVPSEPTESEEAQPVTEPINIMVLNRPLWVQSTVILKNL